VIYHATGGSGATLGAGIVDGGTYWVHVVDAYHIQLADSFCHAVGCPAGPATTRRPSRSSSSR
jgi:hypothetical protein